MPSTINCARKPNSTLVSARPVVPVSEKALSWRRCLTTGGGKRTLIIFRRPPALTRDGSPRFSVSAVGDLAGSSGREFFARG